MASQTMPKFGRRQRKSASNGSWKAHLAKVLRLAAIVVVWLGFLVGCRMAPIYGRKQLLIYAGGGYVLAWLLTLILTQRGERKRQFLRMVLMHCSLLMVAAGFEALAYFKKVDYRVVFGTAADEPWQNPENRVDDELLHVRKPHNHLVGKREGGDIAFYTNVPKSDYHHYDFDIQYDANGFRNRIPVAQPDVVVLGDSFVEAFTVDDKSMLTSQLAKLSDRTVANLGQLWYSPDQELVVLKRYALPSKPKICVWVFFEGNDLKDHIRYQEAIKDWPTRSAGHHSFLKRSFAMNALRKLTLTVGRPKDKEAERSGLLLTGPAEGQTMYFYYPGKPLEDADRLALSDVVGILQEAKRLCDEQGVKLLVVNAPHKFRVYERHCRFNPDDGIAYWKINELAGLLWDAMATAGIDFLDLQTGLTEFAKTDGLLYFTDDTHWTPLGNQRCAELIHQALVDRQWLTESAPPKEAIADSPTGP